ncbi:MAG: hypothetical protein ACXVIY_09345 [Mucilaginibacter sp.]
MKRLLLLSMLSLFCLPLLSNAQSVKTGDWNFDLGLMAAAPIRNLSYYTSLGIGADVAATTNVCSAVSVGARANYSYFIGKTPLLGNSAHGASVINVLADGSYNLPENIFAGVDLGVGFLSSNGQSDTEFARIFNLGYKWDQSKERTYIFTVFFDQTTYQKALGVRAAIRFK